MTRPSKKKVLQYLKEARASELALTRVLQSQIAMTPQGSFRTALERHLFETREHARLLQGRVREVEGGFHPVAAAIGLAEGVVGQALALSKTPLDLVRGSGGEEKVLKNAKDAAATETLEIATYTALEQLARRAGDEDTAELAGRIKREEERMLDRILAEIPGLTDAVYAAEVGGDPSYDASKTGAADAARAAVAGAKGAAEKVADGARDAKKGAEQAAGRAADGARDAAKDAKAGVEDVAEQATVAAQDAAAGAKDVVEEAAADAKAAAEERAGAAKAAAEEQADKVASKAAEVKAVAEEQAEEAKNVAKEQAAKAEDAPDDRDDTDATASGEALEKPWPAYDELSAEEVLAVLLTADAEMAQAVVAYETANQGRAEVLSAAERKAPAA
ncbi:DUF892 family protein [Patulibacter sp.]|uniref:DUF892 family protein n=1 Tax=Patulibacter sp. TaxID=1912859 RepID=UPI00271EAADE|nr:DUF892 family protein [Patulibacter sp.]MDO9410691.1 DUF892 family protein [Patulibacter sp.]